MGSGSMLSMGSGSTLTRAGSTQSDGLSTTVVPSPPLAAIQPSGPDARTALVGAPATCQPPYHATKPCRHMPAAIARVARQPGGVGARSGLPSRAATPVRCPSVQGSPWSPGRPEGLGTAGVHARRFAAALRRALPRRIAHHCQRRAYGVPMACLMRSRAVGLPARGSVRQRIGAWRERRLFVAGTRIRAWAPHMAGQRAHGPRRATTGWTPAW